MTRGECITRLFEAYSKKSTPGLLYYYEEWARGLSVEMVSSIVDATVKDNNFFPTVNKLYEISSERIGHAIKEEPDEECWFCDSIGMIPGVYKDKQGLWSHGVISACKCSKGKRIASINLSQRDFELDWRYLDLMKVYRENEGKALSVWGSIPYFYSAIRERSKADTNLNESISEILGYEN